MFYKFKGYQILLHSLVEAPGIAILHLTSLKLYSLGMLVRIGMADVQRILMLVPISG